ncbi:MAG TPA: site-specific integrase [Dehalococcoidia bacterium]|nr:site-specific integrase [Dehalococcoidia bacterium]
MGLYLRRWLAHVQGRVRAVTYEGYEALIRRHALPAVGELPLAGLEPLVLQELYGDLLRGRAGRRPLAAGTVLNLHLVLTQAFSQAVRWQLLARNPAAGAQPPRPQRAPRLVVDQRLSQRLLAATAGTRFELSCALGLATGMRRGEILALRWSDLSEGWSRAQVVRTLQPTAGGLVFEQPKTPHSRRSVLLPAFLQPYLQRQRSAQELRRGEHGEGWQEFDLLLDRGDGRPWNPDTLSTGWAKFLRGCGLPKVRFHDLRHAHATLMLTQGVHPKIVSERLGHASIGITLDTYSHVLPSLQSQAADAFDALFTADTAAA